MAFLNIDKKLKTFFDSYSGQEVKKEIEQVNKSKRKIIGFFGMQGGVGVSSLMYQIALNIPKKILILDCKLLGPYHYIYLRRGKHKVKFGLQDYLFNELTFKKDVKSVEINQFLGQKENITYINVPPTSMTDYLTLTQNKKCFTIMTNLIHSLSTEYDAIFIDMDVTNLDNFLTQGVLNQVDSFIEVNVQSLSCDLNSEIYSGLISKDVFTRKITNKVTGEQTLNGLYLPYEEAFIENENYGGNYLYNERCSLKFKQTFGLITEVINNMIEGT